MAAAAGIAVFGALLFAAAVNAKGTFYGGGGHGVNPYYGGRYNLFKAGLNQHHLPNKPMSRHKNHCAYVVQRNITCTLQDGVSTFVKAEYTTKCIWGQKCPVVMYRTFFKPKYKVGYKSVTELEWRCCPGFSGENCHDGATPDAMMPPGSCAAAGARTRTRTRTQTRTPGGGGSAEDSGKWRRTWRGSGRSWRDTRRRTWRR